jgi:DNA-binding transcriptional ArsR family regulator
MISTTSPSDPTVDVVNSSDKEQLKLSPTILAMIADFFKILSEVSRLQIVCSLKSGPKSVSQIIAITGLGQANVSKHLKILTDAKLLMRTQQGINVIYEIANPLVFPLCDLVCNSLTSQLQSQNQQLEQIKSFQQSF